MEATGASSCGRRKPPYLLNLPPGFHFAPTDEDLIVHYLRRQIAGLKPLLPIFIEADVVGCRPEKITDDYKQCGEDRWFFFTKRTRKYKRGSRPNRTTPDKGFWKATGPQRMIYTGKKDKRRLVGRVRTLVFYNAPKETDENMDKKAALSEGKTSWTMYEYENLTSEAEAADQNVDKIDEWVLCTIQTQKKEDNKEGENKVEETNGKGEIMEGSRASEKKVKETKEKGKIKAGSKKRKGYMEAENGTEEDPIQALRSKLPMQPAHPETFALEEGDEMGMLDAEYNPFPSKSSPVPTVQQHESPRSETMSPCITDNNYYGPNMAPTPCLQEPPHSEMTSTSVGGNYYNIGSAGSDFMSPMLWQGSPFSEIIPPACLAENTYSSSPSIVPTPLLQEAPHMKMEYQTPSSFLRYNNYHNIDPSMATHQPAISYPYPLSGIGYGGAVQNAASHFWYPAGDFGSIFSSIGFNGGPSVPGPGRAVRPATAALDQVTART